MSNRCQYCNALIYSRASGVCTECRAPLPSELQLSEEEKKSRAQEAACMKIMLEELKQKKRKR